MAPCSHRSSRLNSRCAPGNGWCALNSELLSGTDRAFPFPTCGQIPSARASRSLQVGDRDFDHGTNKKPRRYAGLWDSGEKPAVDSARIGVWRFSLDAPTSIHLKHKRLVVPAAWRSTSANLGRVFLRCQWPKSYSYSESRVIFIGCKTKKQTNIKNFLRHADKSNALKFKLWVKV
jgi:hypothetical protein